MEEKSDCTTNGSNTAMFSNTNGTVYVDTKSDPGSWEQALKYNPNIKIKPGA